VSGVEAVEERAVWESVKPECSTVLQAGAPPVLNTSGANRSAHGVVTAQWCWQLSASRRVTGSIAGLRAV
jgi:hypothetical protein